MALDAAMIRIAAEELNEKLSGARAEKIYMPSRDEVVLSMRTQQGRQLLFLSARSGAARAHITACASTLRVHASLRWIPLRATA